MRVSIQDFGSGIPLPHYGAKQPNHDYYASNITLNNMNFVDCATGMCHIYYYDDRTAGKDGNCVSSLRWQDIVTFMRKNKDCPPTAEVKILDNCVGQNKSNTTHKFSMMLSILFFPDGVRDIYFKVGHSHNQSDMKTAHAKRALARKNLYVPQAVVSDVNHVQGLTAHLVESRVFQEWKCFLDKHFPNMDVGFTSFHIYEFKDGVVKYQVFNTDGEVVTVKERTFCPDPESTRKVILRELLNLSPTSSVEEICCAKPRLPYQPERILSKKKIMNMKMLYQQIPRNCRWYYPEGETVEDNPHTQLRARVATSTQPVEAGDDPEDDTQDHGEVDIPVEDVPSRVVRRQSSGAAVQSQSPDSVVESSAPQKRRVGRPR